MSSVAQLARYKAAAKASMMLSTLSGGVDSFYANYDIDKMQVRLGVVDERHYLLYQEHGFASFPMWWVDGRVIPLTLKNGTRIFRRGRDVNKYKPGPRKTYWYRQDGGKLAGQLQTSRRWVHPGLPPKNFMRDAVREAIAESQPDIDQAIMEDIEQEYGETLF